MTDEQRDRMCELCADHYFEGSVNTNQFNQCEGAKCDDANELIEEEIEIEHQENTELIKNACETIENIELIKNACEHDTM